MFIKLLILFTFIPILEIFVLIEAGRQIGVISTISLVILTGIAGAFLARSQGFELMMRIQSDLQAGRVPAEELFDGAMILAGGVVLLTPGFCTDLIGFMLLTPVTRSHIKTWLRRWVEKKVARGEIQFRRY
ncbi:FxsA family protein [Pelovirga terrestris]|uniref:Membrane protein FxsA n=1 Tax=Pelovirga terrestris TaxID=2771352 RepID=A0A8J6QW63_9BACT|nr:FxsA family protein [Pelovirga terrestris]MBD1399591.1 membrane protein FxsA [Pelovirga terrestris]